MSLKEEAIALPTIRLMKWASEHADRDELERLKQRELWRMDHRRRFPVPGKVLSFDINDLFACEAIAVEVAARTLYYRWLDNGGPRVA